jgi:predicted Ser/Thr protein kinase
MNILLERMVKNKIQNKRARKILSLYKKAKWVGRGRHSVVLRSGDLAIKIEKDAQEAKDSIKNEAYFLRRLNKYGIGPKFRGYSNAYRYIKYDFVRGKFMVDFLKEADDRKAKRIIKKCLEMAFNMDLLRINKEEFHRPLKHIIVRGNEVRFIDFERCHYSSNPKNLSQLISFFFKNKDTAKVLRDYKKDVNTKNFKKVLTSLEIT